VGGVEVEASLAWTNCTRFGVRFDKALGIEELLQITGAESIQRA